MTLTAAIKERLQANEAIRAIVDNRVAPMTVDAPLGEDAQTPPVPAAVVIECIARSEAQFEGIDEAANVLTHRYRITAISRDFDEAEELGQHCRASLHFFAGPMADGVDVRSCRLDAGYHEYEATTGAFLDINEFELVAEETTAG